MEVIFVLAESFSARFKAIFVSDGVDNIYAEMLDCCHIGGAIGGA